MRPRNGLSLPYPRFVILRNSGRCRLCGICHVGTVFRESKRAGTLGFQPFSLVRVGGLEPPRAYTHCHLKTARLPFRHTRRQVINLPLDCRNVQIGVSRCVARGLARKQRRSLRPLVGRAGSFFTGGGSITPTNVLAPCTDFEVVFRAAQPHVREQAFHRLGTDRAVLVQRE